MLHIYTIPVTPFEQNARVLFESNQKSAMIVDPGGDIDSIMQVVQQLQPAYLQLLLTHAHIDHAGGTALCLSQARQQFGPSVPLVAHSDPKLRQTISQQAKLFGLPVNEYQNAPDPDHVIEDGDRVALGDLKATVRWVPGHAPDHVTLFFDISEICIHDNGHQQTVAGPVLLAGDTLFAGSIGRTDLPGGSLKLLLRGIHDKLMTLPDTTLVLCGHGPSTTIGQERKSNPFLQNS